MDNGLLKICTDIIIHHHKDKLEALVLVGSFARGEEIVRIDKNGKMEFISDLEFMAVVKPEHFPAKIDLAPIESEIEGAIALSVGQTTKEHLKKLKPYIFTLELKNFGKVLWGDEKVLDLIPSYTAQDLDPLDSFVLLNNRIVEQVKLRLSIDRGESWDDYHIDKGYVQIVNSLLGLSHRYKSLYPEKLSEFLQQRPIADENLITAVKLAFHQIEKGTGGAISRDEARMRWDELRNDMKKVWFFEARALLKDSHMDESKALKRFPLLQKFPERFKGWVKMFRDGKTAQQKESLSGNFLAASPQFLIYREAVTVYFAEKFDAQKAQEVVRAWEKIVK